MKSQIIKPNERVKSLSLIASNTANTTQSMYSTANIMYPIKDVPLVDFDFFISNKIGINEIKVSKDAQNSDTSKKM
jgi:hypothetical protein